MSGIMKTLPTPFFSRGFKTPPIGIPALALSLSLLLVGCTEAVSQPRLQAGQEVLIVNSDPTDPAVPLDLS
jgi:hypothetical protein